MRAVRRLPLVVVALVAVALVAGGGCGDGGGDESGDPASSTTTSTSTTSTTTPDGTSETAPTQATPEAAAMCLFDAWLAGDEAGAQACADDIAIDELFGHPAEGAEDTNVWQGCVEEEAQHRCAWTYPGGSMGMIVVESDAYGWRVADIEYVAD
jgi:hypothetical protein